MAMDPEDYNLSMAISARGRTEPAGLRSLLVHRLSEGRKAVLRRGLRNTHKLSLYCEVCRRWVAHCSGAPPNEWVCLSCKTWYRVEFAVYAAIQREDPERGYPIEEESKE